LKRVAPEEEEEEEEKMMMVLTMMTSDKQNGYPPGSKLQKMSIMVNIHVVTKTTVQYAINVKGVV